MQTYLMADPIRFPHMTTRELRETFLVDSLFSPGALRLAYINLDRAVVGMATPLAEALPLTADPELRAEYFTERRELGVLNIGGSGSVEVEGRSYPLENLDCLYIGRGNAHVLFRSKDPGSPAVFYLLSYPAHASYPVALVGKQDAQPTVIGSAETANHRTVSKYISLGQTRSCQLVMGVTHLHPGSTWNTMPPHTHMRRSEIYMYFNLPGDARVFHFMGPGEETRHLVMANREVVVSPGWSVHTGAGTSAYSFCWGMGGENQHYDDMDPVPIEALR